VVKLAAVVSLAPLCLSAGILVVGDSPLGMLADATLAIPPDPGNAPVPMMSKSAQGSWSGTMMVEGGSGLGYLEFYVDAMATSFSGSPSSEYMQSYSALTAPFPVYSRAWFPQGSTNTDCYCYLPFTFDVPQRITFSGYAYSSYVFGPMLPGVPPYLAGDLIWSWTSVGIMGATDINHQNFSQEVSVLFSSDVSVPEPESRWFGAIGIMIGLVILRRRISSLDRTQPRKTPTQTGTMQIVFSPVTDSGKNLKAMFPATSL
jgi:hypothetical protein